MSIAIRWFCSRPQPGRLVWRRAATLSCSALLAGDARKAHDYQAGQIAIDYPYATPSFAGVRNGAVYLRCIRNRGDQSDRLMGASTPIAACVELQRNTLDGGALRMDEVPFITLPPRTSVSLRHGGELQLMLINLKQQLKHGDHFDLMLHFERAGSQTVKVWVQTAREAVSGPRGAENQG